MEIKTVLLYIHAGLLIFIYIHTDIVNFFPWSHFVITFIIIDDLKIRATHVSELTQ